MVDMLIVRICWKGHFLTLLLKQYDTCFEWHIYICVDKLITLKDLTSRRHQVKVISSFFHLVRTRDVFVCVWSYLFHFVECVNVQHNDCLWCADDNDCERFQREGSPNLACNDRNAFFTSENPKKYYAWLCQNVCDALTFLLDNIFIRFGTKQCRQVVWIPMGTNCAPLFCFEREFMASLSDNKQADVIDAFYTTSRYLDDILNINNVYFDNMVSQIHLSELQLYRANTAGTEAVFLDLHLSISIDLFLPKFIINAMTLILKLSISHF